MKFEEFIFDGLMFAFMLMSMRVAQQRRMQLTIICGALAWASCFIPGTLIWPNPEGINLEWWWPVGGLFTFLGIPLFVLFQQKRKRRSAEEPNNA